MNILGHMWKADTYKLTLSKEMFCRLAACTESEFDEFVTQNKALLFCDISVTDNARITVLSRRRKRQDKRRETNRLRQQRRRRNANVTPTESRKQKAEYIEELGDLLSSQEKQVSGETLSLGGTQGDRKKSVTKKFSIPTPAEVDRYCQERKNGITGQEFCDFYQCKDWMVGKNRMKDWKAAIRTWETKRKQQGAAVKSDTGPKLKYLFDYDGVH